MSNFYVLLALKTVGALPRTGWWTSEQFQGKVIKETAAKQNKNSDLNSAFCKFIFQETSKAVALLPRQLAIAFF